MTDTLITITQIILALSQLICGGAFLLACRKQATKILGWLMATGFLISVCGLSINVPFHPDALRLFRHLDILAIPCVGYALTVIIAPEKITRRRTVIMAIIFSAIVLYSIMFNSVLSFTFATVCACVYSVSLFRMIFERLPHIRRYATGNYSSDLPDFTSMHILAPIFATFAISMYVSAIFHIKESIIMYNLSASLIWILILRFNYNTLCSECSKAKPYEIDDFINSQQECEIIFDNFSFADTLMESFEKSKIFLNPKITLNETSKIVGTNRTYLSLYLNKVLHTTFYDYVNRYRAEYAAKMFSDEKCTLNIKEVATASGFTSMATFRRFFTRHFGMTPSEFRKNRKRP